MFLEEITQLQQWINNLQESKRIIIYSLIYIGIPLLCIILIYIDKNIEIKKWERDYYGRKKENSFK